MKIITSSSRTLRGSFFAAAAVVFSAAAAHGQANQWLFNEANGSTLSSAVDSIGGSSWSGDLGPSTIQSGSLSIGGINFGSDGERSTAPVGASVIAAAQAGGTISVVWEFSGWDFATRQPQFQMGFEDASGDFIAALLVDVGGSAAFFGGLSDTGSDIPSASDLDLDKAVASPYLFEVALDYTALTYTVSYSVDGGATLTEIGSQPFGLASDIPASVAIWSRFTQTDTFLNVSSVTVIPEPSTYAAIAGLMGLLLVIRSRRRK